MSALKYSDSEADFWKELFVHLQHKNMVRTNAKPLQLENCKADFDAFAASHPQAHIYTEYYDSYCTFEVTLTATIKLRLYIQSAIKGSLLQKTGSDYVKLCDAKFPYNPLPEIDEFLVRLPDYLKDLEESLENKSRSLRRQKLAMEFIKAYAAAHIPQNMPWKLELADNGSFILSFPVNNTSLELTDLDFIQKIASLNNLHIFA